ncbi:hypothetical protein [Salinibacter ruber]|uniref:hypothetical protein n=1 Tax=Salinibacter ruber TaxID=146919 RepID=UPI000E596133|nr:hypothetical protein [Salinibacter ruber]
MGIGKQIKLAQGIALGFGALGFVPLGYGAYRYIVSPSYLFDLADLGTFVGGTSGPLWSLAAFAALYLGFLAQRRDIELQREDMKLQEQTFERQHFEDNFFRLLEIYEEEIEKLRVNTTDGEMNEATEKVERTIKSEALKLKASKYFDHDDYFVGDGNVWDGRFTDPKSDTSDVANVDLSEKEKIGIVSGVLSALFDHNNTFIFPFLNAHLLMFRLLDDAREKGIDVSRHYALLNARTREEEKRLIYWLTYGNDETAYSEKIENYDFLEDLDMPEDFTDL